MERPQFSHSLTMRHQYRTMTQEMLRARFTAGQELLAEFRCCLDLGKSPHDPAVAALAQRWQEQIEALSPAGEDLVRSAESYYQENPDEGLAYGMDGELYRYIKRAVESLIDGHGSQSSGRPDRH